MSGTSLLALVALLAADGTPAAAPAADTLVELRGTVRAPGYRSDGLLPGALVEVRQEGRSRSGVADGSGRYRIGGLGPGGALVSVRHLGAHPLAFEVRLPSSGAVTLDLELERRTLVLAPLRVRAPRGLAEPVSPLSPHGAETGRVGLRALAATSGIAESGLATVAALEMGDGEDGSPDRALLLRGSTVDSRTVFLDGAPVLTPFHVAGLIPPFQSELLGEANLFLGGAPARYQGGLSYVLDLETRPARRDRVRGRLGADGLTAGGVVEAPLPLDGSLLVGGRVLHALQEGAGDSGGFPYAFGDGLARIGFRLAPDHQVAATAFRNREGVRLGLGSSVPGAKREARWGNEAFSLRYQGRVGSVGLEATGASSRYASTLPVVWDDPVLARAVQDRERAEVAGEVPVGEGTLRLGASLDRTRVAYRLESLALSPTTVVSPFREELAFTTAAVHGEWEGEVGEGVFLRTGLRAERTDRDGGVRAGPRLGLRLLLGESAAFSVAAGTFHQAFVTPGLRAVTREDAPEALGWAPLLQVARSTHLVAGVDQELDRDLHLEVRGFAKSFRGVGVGGGSTLRSSGMELRTAREGERFEGWLGYALSWFWAEEGVGGSTRFDGRHLLSAGARVSLVSGLDVGGRLGWGAGLPFTSVPMEAQADFLAPDRDGVPTLGGGVQRVRTVSGEEGGSALDPAPPGDFLRMDLEVGWLLEPTLGGRRTELRPYVRVLNALSRRDALFYFFDRFMDEELRPVAQRPLIPLLGVEWRF